MILHYVPKSFKTIQVMKKYVDFESRLKYNVQLLSFCYVTFLFFRALPMNLSF